MNIRDQRNYLIHPYYIMMGLLLMGVTALFVGFVGSYMYNRLQSGIDPIQLPNLFYFNTLLLLASSWTIVKTKKSYLSDQTEKYKLYLGITLLLTTGFLISQIIAYIQLQEIELRLREGERVKDLAVEYGVTTKTIYNHIKKNAATDGTILEMNRLKRENKALKELVGMVTLELKKEKKLL